MSKNKKKSLPKARNPFAMATRMMGKRVVADKKKVMSKKACRGKW